MRIANRSLMLVAAVISGVVLAACGSTSAASSSSSSMHDSTPAAAAPAATQNIVQIASSNSDFSTLVTAVKTADLAGTLSGPGPFTLFAPTNEAFAALPAGTLDSLLKPENKGTLASILTYHVVSGSVYAKDVKAGSVVTVNGAKFTVSMSGGSVYLTDDKGNMAKIVTTDIAATNGVIHVINAVLLP
jgi:uncharacterized surface protein with fasciclin (FAS1) repeats